MKTKPFLYVTVSQAAKYIDVNEQTIRKFLREGKYITGRIFKRKGIKHNWVEIDIDSMYKLREMLETQPEDFKKRYNKLCYEWNKRNS